MALEIHPRDLHPVELKRVDNFFFKDIIVDRRIDGLTFRNDTWIHECGQREVCDNEERDDTLDCGNIRVFRPIVSTSGN